MFGDSLRMGITTESSTLIKAPLYRRLGRLLRSAPPEVVRDAAGEHDQAEHERHSAAVLVNVLERLFAVHHREDPFTKVAYAAPESDRQDKRLERDVRDTAQQHEDLERRWRR